MRVRIPGTFGCKSYQIGKWYEDVPKDPIKNAKFRMAVLEDCHNDKEFRQIVWMACKQDFLFWVNVFVMQYNAQLVGDEKGPFITWDFQDQAFLDIIDCVEGREDLVIEKSREMGASWMCLIVMLWYVIFHEDKKFLLISRNADAVDKPEDPDCLFWKIDFITEHLPEWMSDLKRNKFVLTNRMTDSAITGQATTGKAGVGGRATAMFIDEFSQIDEGFEVLHRTADTTRCRIFNFTHMGEGTAAFEISQDENKRKLRLHWSQHPHKKQGLYRYENGKINVIDKSYRFPEDFNFVMDGSPDGGPYPGIRSPWYDEECKRRVSPRAISMDLDINPRGATHQYFPPELIRELKGTYAIEPYWEGDIHIDADTGRIKDFVALNGGPLKLWVKFGASNHLPPANYAGGCDISQGTGATPSCFSIVNADLGEKVAEYCHVHMTPEKFAAYVVALCWAFKNLDGEGVALAWEKIGPGVLFSKKVIEFGYRNVYYRANEHILNAEVSKEAGWVPSPANMNLVLGEYRSSLSNRTFINRSWKALDECLSFVYTGTGSVAHGRAKNLENDPMKARENHGDRVIGDALANMMARRFSKLKKKVEEQIQPNSLAYRRQLAENASRNPWG